MTIFVRFARIMAGCFKARWQRNAPHRVDPDGRELRQLLDLRDDDWASMKMQAIYDRLPDYKRQRVLDRVRSTTAAAEHDK